MKKIVLSALLLAMTMVASAIPAQRVWHTVTQSDGTKVQLMLVGDEFLHYYVTRDGKAVVEQDGKYVYAKASNMGVLPSTILVHEVGSRSQQEIASLDKLGDFATGIKNAQKAASAKASTPRRIGTPTTYTGSKKGIIILMNFKDLSMVTDKSVIDDAVNKSNYTETVVGASGQTMTAVGSVHDYFTQMSDSLFDLSFDVVGPYTANSNMAYYGANTYYGNDGNANELIREAVRDAANDVDMRDYDWDGDGFVDQVFVIYAGYAESSGASSNTIWPHESQLYSPLYVDGVYVSTYACGSELSGTTGSNFDGIGTIVHEFSHCLGLPDFYDVSTNRGNTGDGGNYGMNRWSVMDQGSYNGDGWIPAPYTGYERNFCGWLKYRDLVSPCRVTGLQPLVLGGETYRIVNPGNSNEYYLLENRNGNYSWDKGLATSNGGTPVRGLMIYHVTYDRSRFARNSVNTSGNGYQCMTIVHADNSDATTMTYNGVTYLNGDEYYNDLYPYTISIRNNHNAFSDTTTPADSLNTPNSDGTYLLHTDVSDITRAGRTVRFTFMNGTQPWTDATTGISQVNVVSDNSVDSRIFNLAGQQVTKAYKGIVINNGKKYIQK